MEEDKMTVEGKPVTPGRGRPNIWKLLTIFLITLLLLGGAYYFGTQKNANEVIAPTTTPAPALDTETDASPTPLVSTSPSPSKEPAKSVEAGGKIGVFMPYRVQVPASWGSIRETTQDVLDVLEISKDGYTIRIQQAGGGGSICNYGTPKDEPFTQNYAYYKTIIGNDYEFRRSGDSANSKGFTICDKKADGYGFPSFYGYISYSVPSNPSQAILSEMDSILSTLVKQ